jgi:subtilisin family serine protease
MLKKTLITFFLILITIFPISVYNQDTIIDRWQYKAISFSPDISNLTKGDPSVVVAIIDSGIDFNHYDLGIDLKYNNPNEIPNNNIDDDRNGFIDDVYGWDFVENDNNPTPTLQHLDDNNNGLFDEAVSHGTAVAGIIAGQGNDVIGFVPKIKILDIKIYNSDGSSSGVESAFKYVYNLSLKDPKIKIINYSSSNSNSGSLDFNTTLDSLLNNNIAIVASSGNEYNKGVYNVSYPANYNNVISVGSVDRDNEVSPFSQRGKYLDFVAPGENVFSLSIKNQINNNLDGTSFSAPFYSGAIAFLLSLKYQKPLSLYNLTNLLLNSVTDLGENGWDSTFGYGLLNMTKLIKIIEPITKINNTSIPLMYIQFSIILYYLWKKIQINFRKKNIS